DRVPSYLLNHSSNVAGLLAPNRGRMQLIQTVLLAGGHRLPTLRIRSMVRKEDGFSEKTMPKQRTSIFSILLGNGRGFGSIGREAATNGRHHRLTVTARRL